MTDWPTHYTDTHGSVPTEYAYPLEARLHVSTWSPRLHVCPKGQASSARAVGSMLSNVFK